MNIDFGKAGTYLALLFAAALALPTAAAAQEEQDHRPGQEAPSRPEMPGMRGMMMGMQGHGAMMSMRMTGMMAAPGPMMILRQKEALALTDDQVQRLQTLQERMAQGRREHMETMRTVHERIGELARGPDLDLAAYEEALRSMADAHVAMQVAMARLGREAREDLTPEQREKLRTGMQFMRGMMQGMHSRMGPGEAGGMGAMMMGRMPCPMMGGPGNGGSGH